MYTIQKSLDKVLTTSTHRAYDVGMRDKRVPTTIKLSTTAMRLLTLLAEAGGVSRTAILERLIRQEARQYEKDKPLPVPT